MHLTTPPRVAVMAAAIAVVLVATQAFAAPERRGGHPREAVKLARKAIQQGRAGEALDLIHQAQRFIADQAESHAKLAPAAAAALDRKLSRLETVAQRQVRHGTKAGDAAGNGNMPALWLDDAAAPGAGCQRPLATAPDRPVAVRLDAAGDVTAAWVRWNAPAAGAFALTASSLDADPSLEVFADCADARPLAANDDHDGLDARVLLRASHAGQAFMVKASNIGDEPGVVEIKGFSVRTISGRVTNEAGDPLSGIYVTAFGSSYPYDVAQDYTDQSGSYTLGIWHDLQGPFSVRTGQYTPSYVHEAWDDVPCSFHEPGSIGNCPGATSLTIDESGTREGVDFILDDGERVNGRVVNARDGTPVANATVSVITSPGRTRSTATDSVGRFAFRALHAGSSVYLHASHPEFAAQLHAGVECGQASQCDLSGGSAVTVQAGGTTVEVSLAPRSFIDVTLTVDGEPPANDWQEPTIRARHANGAVVANLSRIRVDEGRYRVGPLPSGTYLLSARTQSTFEQLHAGIDCVTDCIDEIDSASPIVIRNEGDVPAVAMDLRSLPSISGTVVDAGSGEPIDADVRLFTRGGEFYKSARTDEEGAYTIEGIRSGSYYLVTDAAGFADHAYPAIECEDDNPAESCPLAELIEFGLGSGDAEANFALGDSPAVVGRLFGDGEPLTQISGLGSDAVMLLRATGGSVAGTHVSFDVDTSRYRLTDYPAGSYFIAASVWQYHSQIADGVVCPGMYYFDLASCAIGDARRYTLAGEDVEVDFDLRSYGIRHVLVRDEATRRPIRGVGIDLWDSLGRPVGSVLTGQAGRVAVSGNGLIRVSTDNYFGYFDQVYSKIECGPDQSVYRGNCSLDGATAIRFPNEDVDAADIVFSLRKAGAVFANGFD